MFEYPMCCDWLVFHKNNDDSYVVEDCLNKRREILSSQAVSFLRKLNGLRNPYSIDHNMDRVAVDKLLLRLKSSGFIRTSRFVSKNLISVMYTTMFFHKSKRAVRIAKKLNIVLLLGFLPVFLIGTFTYVRFGDSDWDYFTAGIYSGLLIGMVLHEAGHAISGIAYGARVFEAGVMFRFLLPGAYVLMDDRPVKSSLHLVQIYAAGVEMNLFVSGIAFLFAVFAEDINGFFLGIAIQNILMAALNVIFIWGLDGEKIMSVLFGRRDFVEMAASVILQRDKRKTLWAKGFTGKAATVASACICFLQIVFPVVLLMNVVGVVSWIMELF